ncbi:heparan-alpha-glucosaminide N-acetyltransferase [Pseudovibrio exalbescens]|nr:heparan-alpha-glucosaminide N-acetyltransferase [Pseudovibrio exalbescens]
MQTNLDVSLKNTSARPQGRYEWLDMARGFALWAMAVYHFSWDLTWFQLVDWPVTQGIGWRMFAASIAGSFLFLVGFSSVLAHNSGVRWRRFWVRLVKVAGAALLISVGTHYAFGSGMVRFGILHNIAVSSVLVLPFLRLTAVINLAAALLVLSVGIYGYSQPVNAVWFWTGLVGSPYNAVDFVPVFPWFAAVLLGAATGQVFQRRQMTKPAIQSEQWARPAASRQVVRRGLAWCGRHSLLFYLVHQPVLFGALWTLVALGMLPDREELAFQRSCVAACEASATQTHCEAVCACTKSALQAEGMWQQAVTTQPDPEMRTRIQQTYRTCFLQNQRNTEESIPGQ